MAEITLGLRREERRKEKKEEPSTLEAKLSDIGIFVWTDRHFDERLTDIKEHIATEWTDEEITKADEEIEAFEISAVKKQILKRVKRNRQYIMRHVPFGVIRESPELARAFRAMRIFLSMNENLCFSDTPDEAALRIATQRFAYCDIIVARTFDRANTSINKSVVINQQVQLAPRPDEGIHPTAGGMGQENLPPKPESTAMPRTSTA